MFEELEETRYPFGFVPTIWLAFEIVWARSNSRQTQGPSRTQTTAIEHGQSIPSKGHPVMPTL